MAVQFIRSNLEFNLAQIEIDAADAANGVRQAVAVSGI